MKINLKRIAASVMAAAIICLSLNVAEVRAEESNTSAFVGFTMSPMNQRLILDPGDIYTGSFSLLNPANNTASVAYTLTIRSYYRDEDNTAIFEDVDGMGQMAEWITLNTASTGELKPGETDEISYTIKVPKDAPSGGQYASITAASIPDEGGDGNAAILKESVAMAYTLLAEITGDTTHKGEISDLNLPGFLLNGNITGSSSIKNIGNVHGIAKYTLQVFPLFSNEEVYTNEEDPLLKTILPSRTLYNELTWDQTPAVGIFNVVYTVEFEGVTQQISKMVIKCPIWLLFIMILVVAAIIIWLALRMTRRKGNKE